MKCDRPNVYITHTHTPVIIWWFTRNRNYSQNQIIIDNACPLVTRDVRMQVKRLRVCGAVWRSESIVELCRKKSPPKFMEHQSFPRNSLTDCGNERGSKCVIAESEQNARLAHSWVLKSKGIEMNYWILLFTNRNPLRSAISSHLRRWAGAWKEGHKFSLPLLLLDTDELIFNLVRIIKVKNCCIELYP